MKPRMSGLMKKEATRSILASILSIIIGLVVGCVIILIVGMTSDTLSPSSAWDGIRLIFGGLFSTGRDAAGALTFGFNPTNIGNMLFRATPLILTGLSVALLAVNNPIGVIFTGCFMSMLDISGLQLTNLTAYNEYITDVIIATIVYLSAFSLVIKMFISGRKKRKAKASLTVASDSGGDETPPAETKPEKGGEGA